MLVVSEREMTSTSQPAFTKVALTLSSLALAGSMVTPLPAASKSNGDTQMAAAQELRPPYSPHSWLHGICVEQHQTLVSAPNIVILTRSELRMAS
jgi:hypothetical protein